MKKHTKIWLTILIALALGVTVTLLLLAKLVVSMQSP